MSYVMNRYQFMFENTIENCLVTSKGLLNKLKYPTKHNMLDPSKSHGYKLPATVMVLGVVINEEHVMPVEYCC